MIVIISHPTEELKLIRLQKKLIETLNDDNTIWYRNVPLWIPLPQEFAKNASTSRDLKNLSVQIETITLGNINFSKSGKYIFLPVQIKTKTEVLNSELPLVYMLKENTKEEQTFQNKVQTVLSSDFIIQLQFKQCKLAVVANLHNSGAAVQSCKTSSYILKDSVWFKQAK